VTTGRRTVWRTPSSGLASDLAWSGDGGRLVFSLMLASAGDGIRVLDTSDEAVI
jgi:hypothetical protein